MKHVFKRKSVVLLLETDAWHITDTSNLYKLVGKFYNLIQGIIPSGEGMWGIIVEIFKTINTYASH